MATGVVLLEHFRKHSPGLKELILLSLLTANHAREVADRVGYPKREEAYLCGMFRNLGEVLVAVTILVVTRRFCCAYKRIGFRRRRPATKFSGSIMIARGRRLRPSGGFRKAYANA